MTYRERLNRATKRAKRINRHLTWQEAKEQAKAYLYDVLNIYPSTPAIMRQFRWNQVGLAIVNAFKELTCPTPMENILGSSTPNQEA